METFADDRFDKYDEFYQRTARKNIVRRGNTVISIFFFFQNIFTNSSDSERHYVKVQRTSIFYTPPLRFEEDGVYGFSSICLSLTKIFAVLFSATMHHSHLRLGMVLPLGVLHVTEFNLPVMFFLFYDLVYFPT